MDYVLETNALNKKYGERLAVNNVSMHVRKGDIYGLIGKNGAGKTSLMKLILGLTIPHSGNIKLFGGEELNKERKKIGSLIEAPALYKNETAFENMKRFALLAKTSDEKIKELLDLVGLPNTGKKKVSAFSLGMRQRLGIAVALLGDPELLILDEPINGLDPAGIKEIRDTIIALNQKGVTFLISSHLLDELGKIATNYGIMNDGLLEEITADELHSRCRTGLKIVVDDLDKAHSLLLARFPELNVQIENASLFVSSDTFDAAAINKLLVDADIAVSELTAESVGFEDYFIERLGR